MSYILAIPPDVTIIVVAIILIVPYVFFFNFLKTKLSPSKSTSDFVLFVLTVVASLFVYVTATTSLIIAIAKFLK